MTTLEFICPFCLKDYGILTELVCAYEDDALSIPWQCDQCQQKGEWVREPRKPSLFIRIIQAIKRAWS